MSVILALVYLLATDHPLADCGACHDPTGWKPVRFDHEQTRFPLRGRHQNAACGACHADLQRLGLDRRCHSCHRDPHAGRLGRECDRCHDPTSFASGAGVHAHGRSRFPLYGRHAAVPCDQCHMARADRSFGGVSTRCETCHERERQRTVGTAVDHVAAGIQTGCQGCHNPVAWQRALLVDHERCFPIYRGNHRGIDCLACHTAQPGLTVQGCISFNAACTRCHSCASTDRIHTGEGVAGYQCADRKCYECHPNGGE